MPGVHGTADKDHPFCRVAGLHPVTRGGGPQGAAVSRALPTWLVAGLTPQELGHPALSWPLLEAAPA